MRKVFYILGLLDDSDIEWMADHGRRITLDESGVLIRQGEPSTDLYLLLDGELSVRLQSEREREVARLQSGEVIGEISFIDRRPPTASVVATRKSRLLALPHEELRAKTGRDSAFAARFYLAIATFLADRLAVTTSRLGYGDPDQDSGPGAADDPSILDDARMDEVSMATVRFDKLLRYLASGKHTGSFAAMM